MSCLSWNCQGLGNLRAVHALQRLIFSKDPTVVFLCETKSNVWHMERLQMKFNYDRSFTVDSISNSGSLCVLWNAEIDFRLRSYSQHHIDFDVGAIGDACYWRLMGFYGYLAVSDRDKSWKLLDNLCGGASYLCLCIGNFNKVLQAIEQEGGNLRCERQMVGFRNIVEKCQLNDLGCSGNMYMWFTTEGEGIKVWLDRALGTQMWMDLFPRFRVQHLNKTSSNHVPILLTWDNHGMKRGKKMFRFEET